MRAHLPVIRRVGLPAAGLRVFADADPWLRWYPWGTKEVVVMSRLPRTVKRLRRASAGEDRAVHPDVLAGVRSVTPYPLGASSARRKLEEETRAGLLAPRSRKQGPPATVWQRANPRRPHGQ